MEFAHYTLYAPERELWKPFLNALLKKGVYIDFWQTEQPANKQILIPELYLSSFPVRNANFYLLAETFPSDQTLADSRVEDVLMLSQGIDWIAYFLKKEARKRNDTEDLSLWKKVLQNIKRYDHNWIKNTKIQRKKLSSQYSKKLEIKSMVNFSNKVLKFF